MTRDEAKDHIRKNPGVYLQPDGKKKGYICPVCDSGSGEHGTGMTTKDGIHFTCWSCGDIKNNDIIDIIAIENKITDTKDKFDMAYKIYGFNFNAESSQKSTSEPRAVKKGVEGTQTPSANKNALKDESGDQKKVDYTEYLINAVNNLESKKEGQDYLIGRGLSMATVKKFNLGYDPEWIHPNSDKMYPTKRIIIPATIHSYTARAIDPKTDVKYKALKAGASSIYNLKALSQEQPVFIVEGEFDALSIAEVGGQAVALGTTTNVKHLVAILKAEPPITKSLILALDNDDPGRKAANDLSGALKEIGVKHIIFNVSGKYKDANEALCKDKPLFLKAFQEAIKKAEEQPEEEVELFDFTKNTVTAYFEHDIIIDLEKFKKNGDRKTGFKNLDEQAGGLYPGLYVLGAISSLGKTTFIHQMADNLAEAGEHVLFFSLEQNTLEMVTKSISRIMAKKDIISAMSAIELRKRGFSKEALEAAEEYNKIGDRISVIPCNFDTNVNFVINYTEAYMRKYKVDPIVVVDYLQIIPPTDPRQGEMEKVDHIVRGLKKLQSDHNLVTLVISSVNRSNYLYPIDFESFKHSGGIEYTADVVWGIQLQALNMPLFMQEKKIKEKREAIKKAKSENPRKIELVCLKNRYGISTYSCGFNYNPAYDLFEPNNRYWKELEEYGTGNGDSKQGNRL